jgi:hypothetical protein
VESHGVSIPSLFRVAGLMLREGVGAVGDVQAASVRRAAAAMRGRRDIVGGAPIEKRLWAGAIEYFFLTLVAVT